MNFLDQIVFSFGKLFDAGGHFVQLLQHCVLAGGNAMHPPKADDPARQPDPGEREHDHFYHIWRLGRVRCQAIVCGIIIRETRERTLKKWPWPAFSVSSVFRGFQFLSDQRRENSAIHL
jgi:hypothetical protein